MTKIAAEYERYQVSVVMKKLALFAHQEQYQGQTSSATYKEIVSHILPLSLSSGSRILDAGCGNGSFAISLGREFPFEIQGVDLSTDLIQEAKRKAALQPLVGKCEFKGEDFTTLLGCSDAEFDLIMCIGSLYWGQSLPLTLRTWNRVAKPDGKLLLFLNLLYTPLTQEEQENVGATQFLPAIDIQTELAKNNWAISNWTDSTHLYVEWLDRWCLAMEQNKEEIEKEMGPDPAKQLNRRFITYYKLAQRQAVKRIIIKAQHG